MMPILIPDSMPADWLDDGADVRGTTPDDAELRKAMQQAYRDGGLMDMYPVCGPLTDIDLALLAGDTGYIRERLRRWRIASRRVCWWAEVKHLRKHR
jgi:hypothetical protein